MKKKCLLLTVTLLVVICGCSTLSNSKGDTSMTENVEFLSIGPTMEPTLENLIQGTTDLLNSALDSYQVMTELAADTSAPKKGIKAAQKVEKDYADRLAQLQATDLSAYTSEELSSISLELSNIITAIREARDLLNA